jgi:hypothetical protein
MANNTATKPVVSKLQRQMNFNRQTTKYIDTYPTITLSENAKHKFELDDVDLTSRVYLIVEGTFDAIHGSSTSYTAARHAPYSLFNKINVKFNSNQVPYDISGKSAYLMKLTERNPSVWTPNSTATTRTANILTLVADTDGGGNENQTCKFVIDLGFMLNERDVNGILLTQDKQTTVTINLETDDVLTAILGDADGFTTDNVSFTVTPIVERFSIPRDENAMPNIMQMKEVTDDIYTLSTVGENEMVVETGGIFRRIWLDFYDSTDAHTDAEMTRLKVKINKSTTLIDVTSRGLMIKNQLLYGSALPAGCYCLDFASQGLPNYGGERDWVDTDSISRFTINPTITSACSCRLTVERLRTLT